MCARQARAQVEPPGFEPPLELSPVYADNSSILALLRHNTSSHTIFKTDYIGFFSKPIISVFFKTDYIGSIFALVAFLLYVIFTLARCIHVSPLYNIHLSRLHSR